ncbi:MAG: hypothetical protein HGA39_09050 [Coriobacteriia bacterium]|nr:hypothetical protein [Coriobacteriia bacterium]
MQQRLQGNLASAAGIALVGLLVWLALCVWLPVRASGASMSPALVPGDIAIVYRHAPVLNGDIALIELAGQPRFLHRVVCVSPDGTVQTKGDANPIADRASSPGWAVSGRVVAVIPVGAWIQSWRQRARVR